MQLIENTKNLYYESFLLIKKNWLWFALSAIFSTLFLLSLILANRNLLINASESINEVNKIMQETTKDLNATEMFNIEGKLMNNTQFMQSYKNVQKYFLKFLIISIISFLTLFGASWLMIYKTAQAELNWKWLMNFILMTMLSLIVLFFALLITPNTWSRIIIFLLFHYTWVVSFSCLNKKPLFKTISNKIQDKKTITSYLISLFILILLIMNNAYLFSKIEQYNYFLYISFAWLLLIVIPFTSFLGVCFARICDE